LYWEKPTEKPKQTGEVLGIDVGINKLMTLSDGTFVGKEIKILISKLNRRKQKSKGWHRTLEEIKSYRRFRGLSEKALLFVLTDKDQGRQGGSKW